MTSATLPMTYTALPKSGRGPAILVIHAWWGLNDFFKSLCDRLAAEGFIAMAPDLFGGQVVTTVEAAKKLRAKPRKEPVIRQLLRAAQVLKNSPGVQGDTIGIIGFSMGGHLALWMAEESGIPVGAVVFFYGTRAGDY